MGLENATKTAGVKVLERQQNMLQLCFLLYADY